MDLLHSVLYNSKYISVITVLHWFYCLICHQTHRIDTSDPWSVLYVVRCWCVMHVLVLSAVTANLTTEVSSNPWQITDDVILTTGISVSTERSADEQHRRLQRAHWHSTDEAQNKLNLTSIMMRTNCTCHEMLTSKSFHFKQVIRNQK